MTQFLVFTLYAPLASWGEIAMGEQRGSWAVPSRSAVLGLVAAALGLTRDDVAAHEALDAGYGFAVRQDAPGVPLSDYHTTQTMAQAALMKNPPATRRDLLLAAKPETILSHRAYRADTLATAALWPATAQSRWPLEALVEHLRAPVFTLYAGRKSNPLGLPLNPEVLEAATLAGAFARRPPCPLADLAPELELERLRPSGGWGRLVAHDLLEPEQSGFAAARYEIRRDARPDRQRWLFAERSVAVGQLPPDGTVA